MILNFANHRSHKQKDLKILKLKEMKGVLFGLKRVIIKQMLINGLIKKLKILLIYFH